jgi:hypothetical protein
MLTRCWSLNEMIEASGQFLSIQKPHGTLIRNSLSGACRSNSPQAHCPRPNHRLPVSRHENAHMRRPVRNLDAHCFRAGGVESIAQQQPQFDVSSWKTGQVDDCAISSQPRRQSMPMLAFII